MKEIALHILDISENGITAGASSIYISVSLEGEGEVMKIKVEDNGKGISEEALRKVKDPFYTSRTSRKVGLGLPLLTQHAQMAGGELEILSEPGKGTVVEASFLNHHPDRQPLGDLEGCWILQVTSNPDIEWGLKLESPAGEFDITTAEIRSAMEIETISGSELGAQLRRMLRNNIDELGLV